jgi:hypothetical protein
MKDQPMNLVERLKNLYAGLDRVFGTYRVSSQEASGKRVGKNKGDIVTRQKPVTLELWQGHVDGVQSIGIVPIRDDGTCVFGAIDIDNYSLGQEGRAALVAKVASHNLPLVPCSTKSGGVHLYLFSSEPVEAHLFRQRLGEMAAVLGFASSEIFPKQDQIASPDDCGCWINMPYFDGIKQGRHGITIDAEPIELSEFMDYGEGVRQPRSFFLDEIKVEGELFADGPPCLQQLFQIGFAEGTRNDLMYNAALYCRLSTPSGWEDKLHNINGTACDPPLAKDEIDTIAASVRKKKVYKYTCKREPLLSRCNGRVCGLRAFGVGRDGRNGDPKKEGDDVDTAESFPRLGQLRMLDTQPPIWFWDVMNGKTIQLTTEELQSPRLFQKRCMEALKTMPIVPSLRAWQTFVNEALVHAVTIEAPEDSSDEGQCWGLLEKYCTGKVQAQNKKEILLGKPWTHEGITWFRLSDFKQFLELQRFRGDMSKNNNITAMFKKHSMRYKFEVIDKKGANLWGVDSFAEQPDMDVPDSITNDETPF